MSAGSEVTGTGGSGSREAGQIQSIARAVLTPVFNFAWRVTTEGLEHLPTSGPAIIAPNHVSVLDSFFVPLVLPRRITYVGKSEYMDDWKTKYLFPAMGMIPIDRGGGEASKRALDAAARVLDAGELFGIYPEGTRSRDGRLHRGHTGVARLALRCNAPIIPVGIVGSREVQPPDAPMPRPFRRVHLRFGRPVDPARYGQRADDRLVLRQITDEVMFEIRRLSGQEYVDEYATKKKAAPAEAEVVRMPQRHERVDAPSAPEPEVVPAPSPAPPVRERIRIASAASRPGMDGVEISVEERRSSASVIRTRPLDLAGIA